MQAVREDVVSVAAMLKLLGDPTRLTILAYLKQSERCVCELVDLLEASQPAISQHLKKLRLAGLIVQRRQGTWMYYHLDPALPVYVKDIIFSLSGPRQARQPQCRQQECKNS